MKQSNMKSSRPSLDLNLSSNAIQYLDKIKTKYESPVVILYIDSHGSETSEKICSVKSSKVISITGVYGAYTIAQKFNSSVPGETMLGTMRDREIIKKLSHKSTTYNIEDVFEDIGKEIKKENIKTLRPLFRETRTKEDKTVDDKLSLKSINTELVGDIVYQMHHKTYHFTDDESIENTSNPFFDFGVHVVDVIFPDSWEDSNIEFIKETMAKLNSLIGMNLVSTNFVEYPSMTHKVLFNEAIEYLYSLKERTTGYPDKEIFLTKIRYLDLVHLIESLGFNYMYIIDSSCRSNNDISEDIENIEDTFGNYIKEERKNSNILNTIYKKANTISSITRKKRQDSKSPKGSPKIFTRKKIDSPESPSLSKKNAKISSTSLLRRTRSLAPIASILSKRKASSLSPLSFRPKIIQKKMDKNEIISKIEELLEENVNGAEDNENAIKIEYDDTNEDYDDPYEIILDISSDDMLLFKVYLRFEFNNDVWKLTSVTFTKGDNTSGILDDYEDTIKLARKYLTSLKNTEFETV